MNEEKRRERQFRDMWSQEMFVHEQRANAEGATVDAVRAAFERAARTAMARLTATVAAMDEDELAAYREYREARLAEMRDIPTE